MAFFSHNQRTICYRLLGDSNKPLLIMAHPLGMSQLVWDAMLPALLPHLCVLTWDLPGHGNSEGWPTDSPAITPEDLAQEVIALATLAKAESFHFIGTSIGGVAGQQLLHHHRERLLSATLTNTGATIGTADGWQQRAESIMRKGLAAMAVDIVPRWFSTLTAAAQPALLKGWQYTMGQGDKRSYALLCEMLGRVNFSGQTADKSLPLQLIGGTGDVATPPDTLATLAENLQTSGPVIIADAGHVPSIEAPTELCELLLGLLNR